jgi:hypothetical protein
MPKYEHPFRVQEGWNNDYIIDANHNEVDVEWICDVLNNTLRPRVMHSCDIPGCASCGNPEDD